MEVQKQGVEDLLLLAAAVGSIGSIVGEIFEDGKVDWTDLDNAPAFFSTMQQIAEVDFSKVMPQAKDIDEKELDLVAAKFKEAFDLENDAVEAMVEKGLEYLQKGVEAVQFFINMRK
jgi:hypothetical protein